MYDTSPAAMQSLVDTGAKPAGSVAELAREVDVVFTSLPGPPQVEEVVLGPQGILASMKPGLVLFELSTSSLALNRRMYAEFKRSGGAMLDAPAERHRDLVQKEKEKAEKATKRKTKKAEDEADAQVAAQETPAKPARKRKPTPTATDS